MDPAPTHPASRAGSLPLVGGVMALDFCNTASGRGAEGAVEHLLAPGDLLDWCRHAGVLDGAAVAHLRDLCAAPAFGLPLLRTALALRDAVHRIAVALADRGRPEQTDLDFLAAEHSAGVAAGRLVARDGAFGWTWDVEAAPEAALLGPVAASALALILRADHARLKRCAGQRCGWLFLDETKSNNRRWCEMGVCGNRAKQKRRREQAAG